MSIRCFGTGVGVDRVVVAVLLVIVGATLSEAKIVAEFEDPVENKVVSGIGIVRGWAASDVAGVKIQRVTLLLDEQPIVISGKPLEIPCCSLRGDVASGRGDIPKENALHSGFGFTLNYAVLTEGPHKLTIQIEDSSGTQHSITHAITVVSVAGIKFFDQFDLSAAKVEKQGQEVQVTDVCVRDKENVQVTKKVSTRWRWSTTTQGIELIATTPQEGTCAVLPPPARNTPPPTAPPIVALLESPEQAQAVAGIGVIRGWAFATQGRRIQKVQLFVDPLPDPLEIPYGSVRGDVAQGHPNEPGALNSGFGIALNYGELEAGNHRVTVRIEDTAGNKQELRSEVIVKRIGEFRYVKEVTLEETGKVEVQGGKLIIDGMIVRDHYSDLSRHRILQYGFDVSAQGLLLREDADKNIGVGNCNCNVNGDTANLAALQSNPGADGISLPEFIQAANNTTNTERFSAAIIGPPDPCRVTCSQALPTLTRSNVALDGDSNGDGVPNVTIVGSGITASASNVTIRGFRFEGVPTAAVQVVAPPGVSLTDVAILGNESRGPVGDAAQEQVGVLVSAQAEPEKPSHISRVLIHANLLSGGRYGILLQTSGITTTEDGLRLSDVAVINNTLSDIRDEGIRVAPQNAERARMDQIRIARNQVRNLGVTGINVLGGVTSSRNQISVAVEDNAVTNAQQSGIVLSGGVIHARLNTVHGEIHRNIVNGDARRNREQNNVEIFNFGIQVLGGSSTAFENTLTATITNNQVTDTGLRGIDIEGGAGGPDGPAGNNRIRQVEVLGNKISDTLGGIQLRGGVRSSDNIIQARVEKNEVRNSRSGGITLVGGQDDSRNHIVEAEIRENVIETTTFSGIGVTGGELPTAGTVCKATVAKNIVTNAGTSGIEILGGVNGVTGTMIMADIVENEIRESSRAGIFASGGFRADGNTVEAMVLNNRVLDAETDGVALEGGRDTARDNTLLGEVRENRIENSAVEGISLAGGRSAMANKLVNVTVFANTIHNSLRNGIGVFGGTIEAEGPSDPALDNSVTGNLIRNEVSESSATGVAVIGGFNGLADQVVNRNQAQQNIATNTADGFLCTEGITGNSATCNCASDNIDTVSGNPVPPDCRQPAAGQSNVIRVPFPYVFPRNLNADLERLTQQSENVRAKAQSVKDKRLQSQLFEIADRITKIRGKMLSWDAR